MLEGPPEECARLDDKRAGYVFSIRTVASKTISQACWYLFLGQWLWSEQDLCLGEALAITTCVIQSKLLNISELPDFLFCFLIFNVLKMNNTVQTYHLGLIQMRVP